LGLFPDAGGTWFLERHLGYARAFEWMCSNRRLTADDALAWGLVSAVLPADDFAAGIAETAARWAHAPTRAVAFAKRLFEHAHDASLETQLALEAELQSQATETADFREGVAAFLEKRPPR